MDRRAKILIVDDEYFNVDLLTQELEDMVDATAGQARRPNGLVSTSPAQSKLLYGS